MIGVTCRECCVGYHLLNEMPRVEDNMALETDVHAKGESLSAAALAMASGKHPKLGCHDELSSFGDLRRSPLEDDEKSNKSSSSASGSSTTTWNRDLDEPMLQDNPDRFCLFPIKEQEVWRMYKQAEASFWSAEEIDLSYDYRDWVNLTENEQHFISHVLAFFAASDGIVLENLGVRFMKEIQIPEVRFLFCFSPLFPREKCVHPRANSYSYSLRVLHLANVILTENHSFHRRERSMDSKLPSRTFILVRLFDDRF